MAGLELHEIDHKDISARYAVLIMRKLKEVNTFCSAVNNEARRVTDTLLVQLREEQERYDRDTRHGLTQGAGFPPRRAAPVPS
jgi:predicted secreted Zn-dependent protease